MDRWAVATVQWRVRKVLQLQYQILRDQGRVQHRAQEEGAKIWEGEGTQIRGIIEWHVTGIERVARKGLLGQAELEWSCIAATELPERQARQATVRLVGVEQGDRGQIQEGALLGLLMVRAAARRESNRIQETHGRGGGGPPRPGRVEV